MLIIYNIYFLLCLSVGLYNIGSTVCSFFLYVWECVGHSIC